MYLPTTGGVGGYGYKREQDSIRKKAQRDLAALDDPNAAFQKSYQERGRALEEQYAQMRSGLGAQKKALGEELKRGLARQQAISGAGGGAAAKSLAKGLQGLGEQYGSIEAQLGAQKAAQMGGLEEAKAAERLAREQAIQAGKQFEQTLQFQQGSFADQMKFTWAEFDENKKTNLINAAALLKDMGIKFEKLQGYLPSLRYVYGEGRVPKTTAFGEGTQSMGWPYV